MLKIKIHFVQHSKHLARGQLGVTEQDGNNFKVYVLDTPVFIESLAHEFGHIINSQIKNIPDDEELAELLEDTVRNWLRKK